MDVDTWESRLSAQLRAQILSMVVWRSLPFTYLARFHFGQDMIDLWPNRKRNVDNPERSEGLSTFLFLLGIFAP